MSARTSTVPAEESRPSRWPMWVACLCLGVAAAPFIWRGIQAWQADNAIRAEVLAFFDDVAQGRKDAALAHLSDEYRLAINAGDSRDDPQFGIVSVEFDTRILQVRNTGTMAEVSLSLARSGYTVRPTVHLYCLPDRSWRITRIDHVDVDPQWQQEQMQQANEALADQLTEKLQITPDE